MESQNKKCSSKEHEQINAIFYCKECKIYMCNKCESFHSNLFLNVNHKIDKLKNNNSNDTFTGFCNENNHYEKLDYFCKTHNQLCCSFCLCKIKDKGKGQHNICDVCVIEKIKDEKIGRLKDNIKMLEDLSNTFKDLLNELKSTFEKIYESKDNLKMDIQKIFTTIRNALNQREDELLLEVDNKFEKLYFKEDIIKGSEKLPNKIKASLEKGKIISQNLDGENNLSFLINDCLNIENNIKTINIINENAKKCKDLNNLRLVFHPDKENEINEFLLKIKNFGKICENGESFILEDSIIINNNRNYIESIKNWLSPKKINNTELLYRKSKDGDSYNTFHKLCDNQGANIVLIKGTEGFIFGGYTPLDWDSTSSWKYDNDTFLFSLTNNKKHKKIKGESILCSNSTGPFFPYIGFRDVGKKNMSQGDIQCPLSRYFEDYDKIIPNDKKDRFFDVEEVEVYKILFN